MRQWLACLFCAAFANLAGAQQADGPVVADAAASVSAILTVDIDRMFNQSQFGMRIAQEFTDGGNELAMENRRIADALRAEEIALAEQRPDMDPDVFRIEAEAFDEKAQGIRRAQDAKRRALDDVLTEGRDQFLEVTRPILGQLMVERGAFAILDRRSVLLSLGSIDVTDDVIALIDASIGDGSDP